MKKIMTQRSLEERAQFFKKNLHKVGLDETGSKGSKETEKSGSVHEIIQEAVSKEEPKKEEEQELDLSLGLEEEE